jgi:hypothetical protein
LQTKIIFAGLRRIVRVRAPGRHDDLTGEVKENSDDRIQPQPHGAYRLADASFALALRSISPSG